MSSLASTATRLLGCGDTAENGRHAQAYNPRVIAGSCSVRLQPDPSRSYRRVAGIACAGALIAALSLAGHGQARSVADRVYSDTQATRGQQLYQKMCVTCHGTTLEGVVGPPLAGDAFLAVWSARPVGDLVNKIEQTMPPGQPDSLGRPQAIDLAAFILRSGKFPSGPSDLGTAELGDIAFPTRAPASGDDAVSTAARELHSRDMCMR